MGLCGSSEPATKSPRTGTKPRKKALKHSDSSVRRHSQSVRLKKNKEKKDKRHPVSKVQVLCGTGDQSVQEGVKGGERERERERKRERERDEGGKESKSGQEK